MGLLLRNLAPEAKDFFNTLVSTSSMNKSSSPLRLPSAIKRVKASSIRQPNPKLCLATLGIPGTDMPGNEYLSGKEVSQTLSG